MKRVVGIACAVVVLLSASSLQTQAAPAPRVANTYRDVLTELVGTKCDFYTHEGEIGIIVGAGGVRSHKIVRVGADFVEIARGGSHPASTFVPLTLVKTVISKE